MGRRKSGADLDTHPAPIIRRKNTPLPVNAAIEQLTRRNGVALEMSTRATPTMVRAASLAYIYTSVYHSQYVQGRMEQVERLAVSMGGEGRRELIDVVRAGGSMPDAYFTSQSAEWDAPVWVESSKDGGEDNADDDL